MAQTDKPLSERDANQTLQASYNDVNDTLAVDGFVVGLVGRAVQRTVISATIDDYSFYEGATLRYTLRVTYSNSAHDDVNRVERTV